MEPIELNVIRGPGVRRLGRNYNPGIGGETIVRLLVVKLQGEARVRPPQIRRSFEGETI